MADTVTLRIDVDPVAADDFYWSASGLGSGFVSIDLREAWGPQADRAVPAGWVRCSPWDVSGAHAVAEIQPARVDRRDVISTSFLGLRAARRVEVEAALVGLFERMRTDVEARHDAGAPRLVSRAWNTELADLVLRVDLATAAQVATRVAEALAVEFDPASMRGWFETNAVATSSVINDQLESDICSAVGGVFDELVGARSRQLAASMVEAAADYAARAVAEKCGAEVLEHHRSLKIVRG